MEIKLRKGIVIGREHLLSGINCQDSLSIRTFQHNGFEYRAGVVADGCGESIRSETGAHLATSFLVHKIQELITSGVKTSELPSRLFSELLDFLKSIIKAYKVKDSAVTEVELIRDHFLFTVIGFVIGPDTTIIFAVGDGVVLLNDQIDIRDQQNAPTYPTYHLVDDRFLKKDRSPIPQKFDTYEIDTENLQRLAVATDSWANELGILLSLFTEEENSSPQRLMNMLSQKEKRFKDDAAIIAVTQSE